MFDAFAFMCFIADRASVNKNVFSGLDSYLDDYCSDQEREVFFCRIIPFIIQKALEIQTLKPADGLKIAKHESKSVRLHGVESCLSVCRVYWAQLAQAVIYINIYGIAQI